MGKRSKKAVCGICLIIGLPIMACVCFLVLEWRTVREYQTLSYSLGELKESRLRRRVDRTTVVYKDGVRYYVVYLRPPRLPVMTRGFVVVFDSAGNMKYKNGMDDEWMYKKWMSLPATEVDLMDIEPHNKSLLPGGRL